MIKNITKLIINISVIFSFVPAFAQNNNTYPDYRGNYEAPDGTLVYVEKTYSQNPNTFDGYAIMYSSGGNNSWISGDIIALFGKDIYTTYNINDVYKTSIMCMGINDCGYVAVVLFAKVGGTINMTIVINDFVNYKYLDNIDDFIANARKIIKFRKIQK